MPAPASLISLSSELNGLIDFFERLFSLGIKGLEQVRRRKAGRAAEALDGIHFPPDGFRDPLENIAAGRSSAADLEALKLFTDDTSEAVRGRVQSLSTLR